MSYELCVFRPDYAADRDAAHAAWNDEKYWVTSLPDSDRSAVKWRTKDLLMGFDERLYLREPQAPKSGLFAKWFGKSAQPFPYLSVSLDQEEGLTTFHVFDEAIEISLPWEALNTETEKIVRTVWRHLEQLSAAGWSTIYDTERGVLLDLANDVNAVVARYLENLGPDEEVESPSASATSPKSAPQLAHATSPKGDKPFTGNVD